MGKWRGEELLLLKQALLAAQRALQEAEACKAALAALPPSVAGSRWLEEATEKAEAALLRAQGEHRQACDAFCDHLRQRCMGLLRGPRRGASPEEAEEVTGMVMLRVTRRWFENGRLRPEWHDSTEAGMSSWLAQAATWRLRDFRCGAEARHTESVDDVEGPGLAERGEVPPTGGTNGLLLEEPHKVLSCLVRSAGAVLEDHEPEADHALLFFVCKLRSHEAIRKRVELWRRHHLQMVPIAQLAAEAELDTNTVSGFVGHGAHALHVGGRRARRGEGLCTPLVTEAATLLVQYVPEPRRRA